MVIMYYIIKISLAPTFALIYIISMVYTCVCI